MPKRVDSRIDDEAHPIKAEAFLFGESLLVYVTGAKRRHIRAVGTAAPQARWTKSLNAVVKSSALVYPGYKEDRIARFIAERMAEELNTNVVVGCGIYWDGMNAQSVKTMVLNCRKIVEMLLVKIKEERIIT